jgi:hypothetical protein
MPQWKKIATQYAGVGFYEICALIIIAIAVALRLALIALGWPLLDSDEGTMGLMGMHIAFQHEHPIFFYAQGYMGATEAYLAAAMFHFFGVSSFTLRFGLIIIFTIFLVGMYLLTSLLYTKKLALVTLIMLCLASNPVLTRELVAVGGDPETLLSGTIVLLLASWLALSSRPDSSLRNQGRRLLAYGGWGLATGFGLWSHMLILPFILTGGLLILFFCWRELLSLAPICLLAGLLIGASPLIYYNLTAPAGQDTMFYALHALRAGGSPHLPLHILIPMQIKGAFLISLPTATGANPLCYGSVADVHLLRLGSFHDLRCTLVHTAWPLGIVVLWCLAALMAAGTAWYTWRRAPQHPLSHEDRRYLISQVARLALLINGAIPFLLYIGSPNSAFYPVATSRYLIGLLVTTPAILWPLWQRSETVKPLTLKLSSRFTVALRYVQGQNNRGLVLIGAILLLGVFSTFTGIPTAPAHPHENVYYTQVNTQHLDVPAVQALNRQESALIHDLLRIGAVHIYSDYWTCDRLIFQSQERIICSVVQDGLSPGHNRYPAYPPIVAADPSAAYVFQIGSTPDVTFEQRMTSTDSQFAKFTHYRRLVFDGYAVYQLQTTSKN